MKNTAYAGLGMFRSWFDHLNPAMDEDMTSLGPAHDHSKPADDHQVVYKHNQPAYAVFFQRGEILKVCLCCLRC